MIVRIGSRKSDLARIQAYSVGKVLEALPEIDSVEYLFKSSLGDQNQSDPLWQMPEKGVFTQDLSKDLISKKVDLVVHSWKDLPVEEREHSFIAGTLARSDQRDLLLFRQDRLKEALFTHATCIFTSSPRRVHNLSQFLSWALPGGKMRVNFQDIRGNIQTRIGKLLESDKVDGLIVAKAAIDRLLAATDKEFKESWQMIRTALEKCQVMVLPLKENPTAAGQGAIAIEVRRDNLELSKIIAKINHQETYENVRREREVLKSYGGGCHQKIGVSRLSRSYGDLISLRGQSDSGEVLSKWCLEKPRRLSGQVSDIFPTNMGEARLFSDENIHYDKSCLESARALMVSKWRALPEDVELQWDQVIWVAGLRTWRKLAERGLWVAGSSESLGEKENPRLENIKGPLNWVRVTHEAVLTNNLEEAPNLKAIATYRLKNAPLPKDLKNKSYFYWTSYSSFKLALEVFPEIRSRSHSCGPGKTAMLIERDLKVKPNIYASYKEWLNEFE